MTLVLDPPVDLAPDVVDDATRREFVVGGLGLGALVLAGCGDDPSSSASGDEGFPITIEHTLGRTTIDRRPQRVVTMNERDTDAVLALGVTPVAVHSNYGFDKGVGPWAEKALKGATPAVRKGKEFSYETIAAVRPDLIVHTTSGGEKEIYRQMAAIAPTVGLPKGAAPYSATTEEATLLIAEALGRAADGRRILAELGSYLARQKSAHPSFAGKTVNYLDISPGQITSYSRAHPINATMYELGFQPIPRAPDKQFVSVSAELLEDYDADVVLAFLFGSSLDEASKRVTTLRTLESVRNDRFFVLKDLAFSNSSVLSIPYALDRLLPDIERSLS